MCATCTILNKRRKWNAMLDSDILLVFFLLLLLFRLHMVSMSHNPVTVTGTPLGILALCLFSDPRVFFRLILCTQYLSPSLTVMWLLHKHIYFLSENSSYFSSYTIELALWLLYSVDCFANTNTHKKKTQFKAKPRANSFIIIFRINNINSTHTNYNAWKCITVTLSESAGMLVFSSSFFC